MGFSVLVTFEIGFSVFALKIPGFSVLVSTAVLGFSLFEIWVSVFMNKKAVIRFWRANWRIVRTFLSSSRVTKVSPSYETETMAVFMLETLISSKRLLSSRDDINV